MDRLEKLINILKLTPHRQPELVKEASHRILSCSNKFDPQEFVHYLKPLIEILIQYCDNDDSAQRSLFNDYLNSVIQAFQHKNYQLILLVLLDEVTTNGSARTVTAALQRIPHLINNVKPIELGCEPQKLLKALIEVSRRSDDESVLRALDSALKSVMPYLGYHQRKSNDIQMLTNSLIEVLLRNLQNESSQTKRMAASSLSAICANSDIQLKNTLSKLKAQLENLKSGEDPAITNRFVGFCLCVKEIPELARQEHVEIIEVALKQIQSNPHDTTLLTAALETLRELFKFKVEDSTIDRSAKFLASQFLIAELDGKQVMRPDTKVILQANALACLSALIKQRPKILDELDSILVFKNHPDVAVRNQSINIIGIYIEAIWKFPVCIEQSANCEKVRKLWVELRSILFDESAHPDTLKTCVIAIKTCMNTLLESDHCLHIVEYSDFNQIIQLYHQSNFKPFKIEVLSLFVSLNYRTLNYLERGHWSKMKSQTAGSLSDSLQDRIVKNVVIASLIDEHQRIRNAATSGLVTMIPNLYITNLNYGRKNIFHRSSDPIVALAYDLASEHLVVLQQADKHINHSNDAYDSVISSDLHEKLCIRNDYKFLSSAIIQSDDNLYNEQAQSQVDITKNQHRVSTTINLTFIVGLLKLSIEDSLEKGKTAISSLVRTLYELSLVYPIYQYSVSWDCRPSEYCDCFTLLNFLLTYLENLSEPDVIVEDLEAYKNFLALSQQLLYALCHECVLSEYETQRVKPFHKRQASLKDGSWSELSLKHPGIADIFDIYFTHLTKLLWLLSCIIEERDNPFTVSTMQTASQLQQASQVNLNSHQTLISNRFLFKRIYKKLESSFRSSKKSLNQQDEKFYQILETCLSNMSTLLEFVGMQKSMEHVKDILSYLKTTSTICSVASLFCARQLLKSLFGINILALYQVDPNDWFDEDSWPPSPSKLMSKQEHASADLQGVYHHLVANPYKIFSSYYSINCSKIVPSSDQSLSMLTFESRRALKVRRRIEARVKSLFEYDAHQIMSPKVKRIGELLKNTITEFTPIVTDCMNQFNSKGFISYQTETLHFMSYLILLRVNYQKLALAEDLIGSINELLDHCGEKVFSYREKGIESFLRHSFTFLTLLSYERGPSKPMFQVATVIQKLDDIRADLLVASTNENDVSTYVVPLLRCLVEDLFIYRTRYFQDSFNKSDHNVSPDTGVLELKEQPKKDVYDVLEAERETVAQKLLDFIHNPRIYDLLSILILESRQNANEIKFKKLSQQLLQLIPTMLSERQLNLVDYRCIELTRRLVENISPEVFQPVDFIFDTLLVARKPPSGTGYMSMQEFQRWMSLVIIAIHILITQVKEEVFLSKLREIMPDESFVKYLLHIAQLCVAEILVQLHSPSMDVDEPSIMFLSQQLSSYIVYLTHMFQSSLFFQLSRTAADLVKREIKKDSSVASDQPKSFRNLCDWAREPENGFSLNCCEKMFYHIKLIYPDLTIFWCNVMMLINNVDCNRDYWRNLLVYECHHCQAVENMTKSVENLALDPAGDHEEQGTSRQSEDGSKFKRAFHINRPSSLNLSDVSFSDQLRRSFIKRIAATESRDKALNRNIISTSGEDGQLMEREVTIGNIEQCLSPNIELARRGALCLVLDFVTISMNDVEHITWLIIHHINDIIRWSHETPITEFINAVHGNSASSGIFIQAINNGFNNLTSISFVTRLLWTLEQVHYTQYGSLVVLLVEKLLSSKQLIPYRSLTRNIEDFACSTVKKLLNETNKSLLTTNDEVVNQLAPDDLDRIYSLLDVDLYPKLSELLIELRKSNPGYVETPIIELHITESDSDEDLDNDELEVLLSRANLVYWLAEQSFTAHASSLIAAVNAIRSLLCNPSVVERLNKDKALICFLVSAIYSVALNYLPPPTRLSRPKFWSKQDESPSNVFSFMEGDRSAVSTPLSKPMMSMESKRQVTKPTLDCDYDQLLLKRKTDPPPSEEELVEAVRLACLKGLFLLENIDCLRVTQFENLEELVIRINRLPLINSFVLMPPTLWRQGMWPIKFDESDIYKTNFPMVAHDLLSKDYALLENFCDRLLKLGWLSRRQFEEAWMTLLGVLSTSLSQPDDSREAYGNGEVERKMNLLAACKSVATITKLLLLTRKTTIGDPTSPDAHYVQSFDERVVELTRAIGTNLSSLRTKTKSVFESLEFEKRTKSKRAGSDSALTVPKHSLAPPTPTSVDNQITCFSQHLSISAQKLRMSTILNVEMQDTVVIESGSDQQQDGSSRSENEVDVESCIRLLLSIYKQKFKDPNENLCSPAPYDNQAASSSPSSSSSSVSQREQHQAARSQKVAAKNRPNQLAPPLATAICQSILALSDMFTDYEQFDWLFEIFVQMFRLAERNDDELQMQYLIIGLCKSAAICCYEIPNELTTVTAINHRDVMFEKCRQSIDKCAKSEFGPLKLNALFGAFYMLEDSINIVASGAWELDHFKQLRQSRLTWILKLMPVILDPKNCKLLTKKQQIGKLLECLSDVFLEPDSRGAVKGTS